MKYIDAEKLKEKIQPHYENAKKRARYAAETGTSSDCIRWDEAKSTYEFILYLISSLQQKQPEVDFENLREELDRVVKIYKPNGDFGWGTLYNIALHFYELGIKAAQKGE